MTTLETRQRMLRVTHPELSHGLLLNAVEHAAPGLYRWDATERAYRDSAGNIFEGFRTPTIGANGEIEVAANGAGGQWAVDVSLTLPVDFLTALSHDLDSRGIDRLGSGPYGSSLVTFGGMGLLGKHGDRSTLDRRNLLRRWQREGVGKLYVDAAKDGETGRLSPALAPHLGRVRFTGAGRAEVDDFLALAAFALHEAVMRGGYSVRDCKLCGLPFLASQRANYCKRAAPQSREQSCQQYAKVRDHRARKKEAKRG